MPDNNLGKERGTVHQSLERRTFLGAAGALASSPLWASEKADATSIKEKMESADPEEINADTIVHNGKIVTVDDDRINDNPGTVAEAMAIKNGKVLKVGNQGEVFRFKGPETEKLDLDGSTVMPGIVETHVHPTFNFTLEGIHIGVRVGANPSATVDRIDQTITEVDPEPDEWLYVRLHPNPDEGINRRADFSSWIWQGEIHRTQLTDIAPENPMLVSSHTGEAEPGEVIRISADGGESVSSIDVSLPFQRSHDMPESQHRGSHLINVLNRKGLEKTHEEMPWWEENLAETYPQFKGGDRWIFGAGEQSVWVDMMSAETPLEEIMEPARRQMQLWINAGLTTFQSRINEPRGMAGFYKIIREEESLPVRFSMLFETHRGLNEEFGKLLYDFTPPMWTPGPDPEGRGSWLWLAGIASEQWDSLAPGQCLGPDLDAPPEVKNAELCPEPGHKIWEILKFAVGKGWRATGIHTTGSHGLRQLANMLYEAIEESSRLNKDDVRDMRVMGAHSDVIGHSGVVPDAIKKAKDLNIIVPLNMHHMENGPFFLDAYGPEVEDFILPTKSLLEDGIEVVGETEHFFPEPNDIFNDMARTVTREFEGETFNEDEAVSRVKMLKMWTIWAARPLFAEHLVGSLEPGKFADFIILDRDVLSVPENELSDVTPEATYVNGERVDEVC